MNAQTENNQARIDTGESEGDKGANAIDMLRRFHYGEPIATASTDKLSGALLPALLNPYRDASAIRYEYPLYLAPAESSEQETLAKPAAEHLRESLEAMTLSDSDARILKDNLPWLERYIRQQLEDPNPVDASEIFAAAAAALQEQLDLEQASREILAADLERLQGAIAPGGKFLGYGPHSSLHLLVHAIRHRHENQHGVFREQINKHIHGLRSLLDVEKAKAAQTSDDKSADGTAGQYLDTNALTGMLGRRARGSIDMPEERRNRIAQALEDLQAWKDDPVLVRFVGKLEDPSLVDLPVLEVVDSGDPCTTASETFKRDAEKCARLFAAARIATLEINDAYDPAIHDSWFASFDWQAFSDEEMQLVTKVVALVSADYLAGDGLPSISHLLGSRLPVHVLTWVRAYDNPAVRPGEGPFDAYRFELAYFGVGHRQVVVAQSSAARHEDLLAGFLCALDSNRTSLHLINRGTQTRTKKPLLDAWFVASAALEGRAHPFLLINPDRGDHAAERVSFGGNPQADNDWPVETLEYRSADGETTRMDLAFTFADYALLMPALHDHFRMAPTGFDSPDLVTVDQYLQADDELIDRLVPFVWGIDENGVLARLVVSRALVFACRDRLNYWHTLQELAGVQNFYVEEAVDRIIKEQQVQLDVEREQLKKEHEEQLESARSEAAGQAMGQLVDVLMGADLSGMIADDSQIASMPAPEATPAEVAAEPDPDADADAEAQPEVDEEEDELSFDEPWLDTAMCTTCDDCMGINKMMFVYNEDKQAIIKDATAGPYADLVAAAEICPAKCIHPGKPLDPNEPGLDELIARAEPFN
ncbi:MAG: ferredoxin [Gammaproteobacteria bacterium]|jgi:ferredoxin|nr:ferredoxin [Gammaproteobacteria bacterium]